MTMNRLVPLLGLLVVACGGGTGGPSLGGLFSSTGTPASQSDTPASGSDTPGSQTDTPTGGGTSGATGAVCTQACALAAKYPCFAKDLPAQGCVEVCQEQLASEPEAALCAGPMMAWLSCAERAGLLSCDEDGDLEPAPGVQAACAKELKAVPKECQSSSTDSCEPGNCGGCANACDACMCATNNSQQACASACADG